MHTTWHRFYVLRTPVPQYPFAQSVFIFCRDSDFSSCLGFSCTSPTQKSAKVTRKVSARVHGQPSTSELRAHQMAPAGVIPHSSPPAGIVRHSIPRAPEVCFFFHFFEVSVRLLGLVLPRGRPPFVIMQVRIQGKSELAGQRAHWSRDHSGRSLFGVLGAE